jgi:hypothetical protein
MIKSKMKKLFFNYMLFALLMAGMSFGFVSCNKDDDKNDNGGEPSNQEEEAPAPDTFWDVLAQMVQADQITSDYEGKTFEPTIGVEDPSSSQTRIVYVNDMAAAAKSFAYLTGVSVDENTATYEWKDDKVGTMTYTKVNDGRDYATVDVNIAAVPHLSKIIYRDGEQSGSNGKFSGSAYYRFGDVISRKNKDGKTEYWVCVRPAFGLEKKEDTHWISVSPLSSENITTYKSSHGIDYAIPKNLKYSKEHMQNLAEMLFAMCYPTDWVDNITYYSPKMFHDFDSKNIKYHNAAFWSNVADSWTKKGIDQRVFGKSLSYFADCLMSGELDFLYNGVDWTTWWSNYATFYQAKFVNTKGGKYSNMQTKDPYTKIQPLMVDKKNPANDIKINIKDECTAEKPYIVNKDIFGDNNPRWIVRYATGAELSDSKSYNNVYGKISGVEDVYRYYHDVNPQDALDQYGPEESVLIVNVNGATYYHAGDIITRNSDGTPWMCVRPAGGPNGEAYSYWVCLSPFDQSGKSIISEEKKTCGDGKWIYATNLISRRTAMSAIHTFTHLTDSSLLANNANAAAVYEKIKAANYDIALLLSDYHSQHATKAKHPEAKIRSAYAFAYGNPVADANKAVSKRKYALQPLVSASIIGDADREDYMYYDGMFMKDGLGNSLMSLTDGYEVDFIAEHYSIVEPWSPLVYDYHLFLHKFDEQTKKLDFTISDPQPGGKGGSWMPNLEKRVIISPELKIQDVNTNKPSDAVGFSDVFVSSKVLNGKYFDYWKSLENINCYINTEKVSAKQIKEEF